MRKWKRFLENIVIAGSSAVWISYTGLLIYGVPAKEIPNYCIQVAKETMEVVSDNLCRLQLPLTEKIWGKGGTKQSTWITILWDAQSPATLYRAQHGETQESVLEEPEWETEQEGQTQQSQEENGEKGTEENESPQESANANAEEETEAPTMTESGAVASVETVQESESTELSGVAAGEESIVAGGEEEAQAVSLVPSTGVWNNKLNLVVESNLFNTQQLFDYNTMLEQMYIVNPGCGTGADMLDPAVLLTKDLTITEQEQPQILIYHTHSQEAFVDSVPGDVSQTIVGAGDYLTQLLTEQYGYQVIHHTGQYDVNEAGELDRDPAYSRALPVLEQILQENPRIQVVIDLHRDGVGENVHLVTEVDGKQAARIMFFNGTCRNEAGDIEGMENPYREDNLAFSLQMGLLMKAQYGELFRAIYLKQSRYNQHLMGRSALVEVGAQTNTVEEIYNAIPYLAQIIDQVIAPSGE